MLLITVEQRGVFLTSNTCAKFTTDTERVRVCVCVCVCVCVRASAAAGFAVVVNPDDGGLAEETVLVVHQVLVYTGSAHTHTRAMMWGHWEGLRTAPLRKVLTKHCVRVCVHSLAGLVRTWPEDGRDGMSVADGAEVLLTGRLKQ